jgi:5-oxoprolinase (ATP-hydrolysing) subunit A
MYGGLVGCVKRSATHQCDIAREWCVPLALHTPYFTDLWSNIVQYIDFNCDLGEIEGIAGETLDAQMMTHVSSINVACGGHAGDTDRIRKVVRWAIELNVAIGAHPGYADRANFGRIVVPMSPAKILTLVSQQIQIVADIAEELGGKLHHVKPHGALYNLAATSPETALAIAAAVKNIAPSCLLVGLSGSCSTAAAASVGLNPVHEIFADRNYMADGTLVPRNEPQAVLHDAAEIAARAVSIIHTGRVTAIDGTPLSLQFDTICIHSDTANTVAIAAEIRRVFAEQNIAVRAVAS